MQKGDDFTRLVAYVEERTVLEERLQKMEAFRGSIKDIIFRRVQRDYSTRLTTIRDQFRPTMNEILKRLKLQEGEKDKLREKIDETNDLLTELRFRNEIGEFEEADFRGQENALLGRLTELTNQFDGLRGSISEFMFYLHDDKDFRQLATSEKILDRIEETYRADRARAAELEQARRQSHKSSVALPPAQIASSKSAPPPAIQAMEVVEGEIVDEAGGFLSHLDAVFSDPLPALPPAPSPPQNKDPTTSSGRLTLPTPSPAPAVPSPQPASRRIPESRPAETRAVPKSKVIRKMPNSGT